MTGARILGAAWLAGAAAAGGPGGEAGAAAPAGASGMVEVRLTDHRAGIEDFRSLRVALGGVALHARGRPRADGWATLLGPTPAVDLVPLKDGRWARVGAAPVAAGPYDAARVTLGALQGVRRSAGPLVLHAVSSTVAVDLAVSGDRPAILVIELYVEDQGDHEPGRYLVKVKGVRGTS